MKQCDEYIGMDQHVEASERSGALARKVQILCYREWEKQNV